MNLIFNVTKLSRRQLFKSLIPNRVNAASNKPNISNKSPLEDLLSTKISRREVLEWGLKGAAALSLAPVLEAIFKSKPLYAEDLVDMQLSLIRDPKLRAKLARKNRMCKEAFDRAFKYGKKRFKEIYGEAHSYMKAFNKVKNALIEEYTEKYGRAPNERELKEFAKAKLDVVFVGKIAKLLYDEDVGKITIDEFTMKLMDLFIGVEPYFPLAFSNTKEINTYMDYLEQKANSYFNDYLATKNFKSYTAFFAHVFAMSWLRTEVKPYSLKMYQAAVKAIEAERREQELDEAQRAFERGNKIMDEIKW